jgi:polyisoprenoid-binding protein YceI
VKVAAPLLALASIIAIACGGAPAASTSTPTATATPTTAATATAAPTTAQAGSATWTVANTSKATVKVREQLVGVNLPSDAVLNATGAAGAFTVNPDGTFTADSKITFQLSTLASDQRDRDNFVKQDTLQVRQFPTATFVPTQATGLTLPIAANTELKFTLAGKMTIHGVSKDVTFDVVATREGTQLKATATANPTWKFGDFGMRAPAVPFRVVSVNDEIRVVVDLVATVASA